MNLVCQWAWPFAVHPHVCGEHALNSGEASPYRGSSPRVWGTFGAGLRTLGAGRFIPTCVGNILRQPSARRLHAVHPHVCGEHYAFNSGKMPNIGSSPRVWGTLQAEEVRKPRRRFIPTCVGNIDDPGAGERGAAVHPHVCGEHQFPRHAQNDQVRFIPTCVGNM